MNKNAKIGLIIGGVAVAGGLGYYFLVYKPNQSTPQLPGGGSSTSSGGSSSPVPTAQNILNTGQDALNTVTSGAQQVKQAVQQYLPVTTTKLPVANSQVSAYEGKVVRFNNTEKVYYIKSGQKLWVQDPATLTALGFTFANVINLTAQPGSIPDGMTVTTANAATIRAAQAIASLYGLRGLFS